MASSWHPAAAPSQVCAPDDVSAARVEGRSASGGSAVPDGAGAWLGQLGAAAGTRERAWGPAPTNQGPVFVGPRPGEAALELPLPPELAAELAARGVPLQGAGALAPPPALVAEFGRLQVHGAGPVPAHGQAAQMHLPNSFHSMQAAWNTSQFGAAPKHHGGMSAAPPLDRAWASTASGRAQQHLEPGMRPMAWSGPYRSAYAPRYTSFYGPQNFASNWSNVSRAPETQTEQVHQTDQQRDELEQSATSASLGQAEQRDVQATAHTQVSTDAPAASVDAETPSSLSFEELLRQARVDLDDTFDDDYLHAYGRAMNDTAYRFQYTAEENRYLTDEGRESQTADNRAAALAALAEGERLYAEGRLAEAIMAFEAAVKLDRELSRAWYFLGVAHAESDQDPQAIASLKRALECEHNEAQGDDMIADTLLCLGVSYTNELNPSQALRYLQQWLDLHPSAQVQPASARAAPVSSASPADETYPTPTSQVDELYARQRALLERVQDLLSRHNDAQRDADLYSVLGVVHSLMRDYDAAVLAFRRSVELRPDDYRLWNRLGATLANHFRSMEALRAYRSAIDRRPNFVRAWVNVGTSYANQGSYPQAIRYYIQALQRNPRALHIWSYLRTAAIAMNRLDILAMAEDMNQDNLEAIAAALEQSS
jgi:tetratricopeptide (TPR) repeat protein